MGKKRIKWNPIPPGIDSRYFPVLNVKSKSKFHVIGSECGGVNLKLGNKGEVKTLFRIGKNGFFVLIHAVIFGINPTKQKRINDIKAVDLFFFEKIGVSKIVINNIIGVSTRVAIFAAAENPSIRAMRVYFLIE